MASQSAARVAARVASSPAERAWRTASVASSSRRASGRSSVEAIDSLAVTSAISVPCPSGSTDLASSSRLICSPSSSPTSNPAGALGRLAEPGPAAVQVAGCEPGGPQPQRGASLLVVAGPQGREAGRGALVPVHRVLEGQGGQRPVPGAAGVLGGWPCRRGPGPRQVVGDLGVIDVPAPPGQ